MVCYRLYDVIVHVQQRGAKTHVVAEVRVHPRQFDVPPVQHDVGRETVVVETSRVHEIVHVGFSVTGQTSERSSFVLCHSTRYAVVVRVNAFNAFLDVLIHAFVQCYVTDSHLGHQEREFFVVGHVRRHRAFVGTFVIFGCNRVCDGGGGCGHIVLSVLCWGR